MLFWYAGQLSNPLSAFTNPRVLREFTTGRALVPMQLVSYWADVRLAGFSPHAAYLHQTASFLAALLALYLLLSRVLEGRKLAAALAALLWALTPATAVVAQFLATRHYLEGMLFALLAAYLLLRAPKTRGARRRWLQAAVYGCSVVAMLYKEVFAPLLVLLLLACAWRFRRRGQAAAALVLALCYAAYRFWMLGPALAYDMPYLTAGQYLRFLWKLPYSLSSNYAGYALCAALAALAWRCATREEEHRWVVAAYLSAAAVSLAAIWSVSYPLYGMMRVPDAWHRIVFPLHTLTLIFGAWLAVRAQARKAQAVLALAALLALGAGAGKTRRLWTDMTAKAEREGKFYLANPDKVLLSNDPAWWFIPGVHRMYGVQTPHYVLRKDLKGSSASLPVPLWTDRGGRFEPLDALPAERP